MNYRTISEFCAAVRALCQEERTSEAIAKIVDFVVFVATRDRSIARVFSSQELDELCLEIGELKRSSPPSFDNDHTVVIATALYRGGGHTRVIGDLIKADPARRKTVLLTGVNCRLRAGSIKRVLDFTGIDVDVRLCPQLDFSQRLRWMQDQLLEGAPGRTYLLQHPYDAVAVAAAQPELVGRLLYIHHADHSLALGVHLPHATHIDFNAKSFHNCRDHGVTGNVTWPLVADEPVRRGEDKIARSSIITCSSGGSEKFESPHLVGKTPYKTLYQDVVPLIVKATGGTHIHVGKLSNDILDSIWRQLDARNIPRARFEPIGLVRNLAQTLVDRNVDVYIGSFPWGGGRATVEAMAAGVAIAIHSNYRSIFLTDQAEVYPDAIIWREPQELVAQLSALDRVKLGEHAKHALAFFEANCRPDLLAQAMRETLAGDMPSPPPRPSHRPDPLQMFLDEECALQTSGSINERIRPRRGSSVRNALRRILSLR